MSNEKFKHKYSSELKQKAMAEFIDTDISMIDVCKKHDISYNTFRSWCQQSIELKHAKLAKQKRNSKVKTYSFEERKNIVEAFLKCDMTMVEFAKVNKISQGSISTWVRVYNEVGPQGLETNFINRNKGRKPIPESLREEITQIKNENPTFGMRKVRDFLRRFKGIKVSHKTVGKTLKENDIPSLPAARSRRKSAKIRRFERARPMQLWQSDITSYMLTRHSRRVYLTVFMDDHSRYIVAWNLQLRQTNELVMDCLLNGIQNFGKPEEVLTDQGRQYFAWRGKGEFRKLLDREGIRHVVSRSHHPQTLGKCERFWETVKNELWERAKPQELGEARERLKHFINHYNHFRPHQGLDGMVPADRFFGIEKEVREKIEVSMSENALRMALGELPRVPVFLIGQIGDQAISMHGENGQLVVNTPDGQIKSIDYEKFGHSKQENKNGTTTSTSEAARSAEGRVHESTTHGNACERDMGGGNGGGETKGSGSSDVLDGILAWPENKEADLVSAGSSAGENLAVVTTSDIRDAGRVTEATEAERSSFDFKRESENTKEEDCRVGKTYRDAESIDCDFARDARLQGCENTDGTQSKSRSDEAWPSKEKQDTDGSSS